MMKEEPNTPTLTQAYRPKKVFIQSHEQQSRINTDDLLIKKAGGSQTDVVNNVTTSIDDGK